jgi:hypothetical protein
MSRSDEAREKLRRAIDQHAAQPLSGLLTKRGLGAYRGYAELLTALDKLVDAGARLHEVGRSVRGEPLFSLHFGVDSSSRAPSERATQRTSVVLSGVHPIEWIGIEAHLALLERLARTDLGDRTLISFPIVNPDGLLQVEANLRAGRRRFVRHNARGVDLNRNFDASHRRGGLTQRLLPWIFAAGPRPASEPEVEAIAQSLSSRRIDRAVSLHSFGGAVLFPSAASVFPIADRDEHHAWAKRVARGADPNKPYRAISAARFSLGFTAGGLELDWFHTRHGAISLLVECSRGGGLTRHPSRALQPFAWFNPEALEATALPIADALVPFVRGERLAT